MCSIVNKTDFINPKWNSYDRTVAKAQLSNFGCIFLDEYGCPNDRFITELPDDIEDICQGILYNFCIMEDNNHLKKHPGMTLYAFAILIVISLLLQSTTRQQVTEQGT